MLGPLAVEPLLAGQGYGRHLVAAGIARARERGYRLMILVGDLPYYGRFGFKPVPHGRITMPGPVNPDRLLALELEDGALADYAGLAVGEA
jgi:predicted N-acetyltransferase YhbS